MHRLLARESAGLPTGTLITEAITGQPVRTGNGRYLLRIIDAGEGSSAIYPPAVLEQAAKDRVFAAGTRMHLDHPTPAEEHDQPVRSVKDWAAVLTEDASYNPDAQALEAPIRVFAPYRPLIDDVWEEVGASIHAYIEADSAPGKPTAKRFIASPANSVDFVTAAGRGGRLLAALESARISEATSRDRREQLSIAVKAAYQVEPNTYFWVRDFDEAALLVWFDDNDDRTWQQTYMVSDDDLTVTLTDQPIEVRPVVQYVPVTPPTEGTESSTSTEGEAVDNKELEAQIAALQAKNAEQAALIAEKDKALKANENAKLAGKALATVEGFDKLPEPAQSRVAELLSRNVPVTESFEFDGEQFNKDASAAIKAEADYLAKVAPVNEKLAGFGDSRPAGEAVPARTHDAWGDPIKNVKEN